MVPGGTIRRSDGSILGEAALEFIRRFRADIAVVGAAAIDPEGTLLDFDLGEVNVARAMMTYAKHVILVVDSTKFMRSAPMLMGNLSQVHTLVTDHCAHVSIRRICTDHEVELIEALPRP